MINTAKHLVVPGKPIKLADIESKQDGELDKDAAKEAYDKLGERFSELQETMYAEGKHAVLAVFQAMDTGGKDSTINSVFSPLNAQGIQVVSFKSPSKTELAHDYLWRIHQQTPEKGKITVFNRSHYEDVLFVKVHKLVSDERIERRYQQINDFERMLTEEGVAVVKFFLHISKDYQREQLQERLDDPTKRWKFRPEDIEERKLWDRYMEAYSAAISRCATKHAPAYVVPAERKWYRNLLVRQVLVDILEKKDMKYPEPTFDYKQIVIPE